MGFPKTIFIYILLSLMILGCMLQKIKQLLSTVSTSQAYPFLPLFPYVDEINIMCMDPKERIVIKKNLEESKSITVINTLFTGEEIASICFFFFSV